LFPILRDLKDIKTNQLIRRATLGICNSPLDNFLTPCHLEFFTPYSEELDDLSDPERKLRWENELESLKLDPLTNPLPTQTWGIKHSIFSTFIQRVITPEGYLKELLNLRSIYYGLFMIMSQLSVLGEEVNNFRKLSSRNLKDAQEITEKTKLAAKMQQIEKIVSGYFKKHGIQAGLYIKELDSFRKNHKYPNQHGFNTANMSDELLWIREWRNTFCHVRTLRDADEDVLIELSKTLPPQVSELKQTLQQWWPKLFF